MPSDVPKCPSEEPVSQFNSSASPINSSSLSEYSKTQVYRFNSLMNPSEYSKTQVYGFNSLMSPSGDSKKQVYRFNSLISLSRDALKQI